MKLRALTLAVVLASGLGLAHAGDDEHETLEKVMKEGLKGETSYFGKIKEGTASEEDYAALYELVRLMRGTKAPVGDQAAYDAKVEELIFAAGATTYAVPTEMTLETLKTAANCKACHNDHKPD